MTDIDALIAEARDWQSRWDAGRVTAGTNVLIGGLLDALTAERALSDRLAGAIEAYQNATPRYDWNHGLDAALTAYRAAREEPHDKG